MKSLHLFSAIAASVLLLVDSGCDKSGPRDVGNLHKRSEFTGAGTGSAKRPDAGEGTSRDGGVSLATPAVSGKKPSELAHANTRAIVTSRSHIYFGDAEDDALFALPKSSTDHTRIARRAPMPGALSYDEVSQTLAWIANPGDTVLRMSTTNAHGAASTVRDRGLFTDVAVATNGDVFITEAQDGSAVVTRVTGNTAARVATLDGLPRGVVVDAAHVYVATTTRLVQTSRVRGEVIELAKGSSFSNPQLDGSDVLATTTPEGQAATHRRIILRVRKKTGLSGTAQTVIDTIASNVRDAPMTVYKGTAYWFDADRPALLSRALNEPASAASVTVSEDPIFDRPNALAVDDDGIYIATGYGESARLFVLR